MKTYEEQAFIESSDFPIIVVNDTSAKEKQGGGRPPYWEMVFWWTRKPLSGARSVIAGALLPRDYDKANFLSELKLIADKVPHRLNPNLPGYVKERFKQVKLLDPFAGFGSIPLEAIRLGIGEVVAVELLPTAYIFLKAVVEYPKEEYSELKAKVVGREIKELGLDKAVSEFIQDRSIVDEKTYEIPALICDVAKWGKWITERLREDSDIKELYDSVVAVYIGTWEVKCPICGRYTPLVGNWWLARIKGNKYAYMKPKAEGNKVGIEVVEGKTSGEPSPNVRGRPELAECLLCGSRITYIDPKIGRVYRSKNEVINKLIKDRLEFYPKHAIKEWNRKLEEYLEGKINLEEVKNALARPRLLVKVKVVNGELVFEEATDEDHEKLWKALEKLKQLWGDADIPTEELWKYTASGGGALSIWTWGFDRFYKLFNPRQLLTLVKLVKLIREAGKKIEEEKLREGWSKEEAFRYAEAVTTYLAIALPKHANYNSIVTSTEPTQKFIRETLAFRGIAMTWNWVEEYPVSDVLGSFTKSLKSIINGLSYLIDAVSGSPSRVRVLLDDATVLSKLSNEKFDVIVTDPPYRDDVPYAELSDFYYVWLKRALSDDNLAPRFHSDVLVYNTQWESFALNEISYNKGRLEYFGVKETEDYYEKLMSMAFRKMSELLKDDRLVVTYFAHSSPEAWIELVEAGWRRAGLRVTRAWAFATESAQRVTARGKTALESSIVVVWRKRDRGGERVGEYVDVYREALENARKAKEEALKSGLTESDLFLATMLGALSTFTSYDRIVHFGKELTSRDVVRESYAIATRVIANATEAIKSPEALFYLASKAIFRLYSKPKGQTTLLGLHSEPIVLSSQDVIILSYGFLRVVNKAEKEGYKLFETAGIIKSIEEISGAKVAKQKVFVLLEQLNPTIEGLKKVLGERGVNPIKMEAGKRVLNSIDALHLLEYYAKQGRSEFKVAYQTLYSKYPKQVREAVEIANVISGYGGDPESNLTKLVKDYIGGR